MGSPRPKLIGTSDYRLAELTRSFRPIVFRVLALAQLSCRFGPIIFAYLSFWSIDHLTILFLPRKIVRAARIYRETRYQFPAIEP